MSSHRTPWNAAATEGSENGSDEPETETPRRGAHIPVALRITALLLSAVGAVILLPIRFPSGVNTYARITPAHKWVLAKGSDGQLIARTFNYETGMSDGYRVSNFIAGSSISFTVAPSLLPGRPVAAGDTVGWVSSSEMQERLVALNGQLAAAQQLLAVNATGQKSAIVTEAERRLQFARRRRADYQTTLDRTQALFDRKLIPAGEYDSVQGVEHQLEDEVSIAEANLDAARTGAKPEQLALVESNIAAIKNEIRTIHSRAATYTLRTPIQGEVSTSLAGDTLLTIAGTSEYVAQVPIRWPDYPRVAAARDPSLTIVGFSRRVRGRIIALGHEVQVVAGDRVVMATALLDPLPEDLLPGSIARCRIDCGMLTAVEYGKQVMRSVSMSTGTLGGFW
jgi:hypothetical protein